MMEGIDYGSLEHLFYHLANAAKSVPVPGFDTTEDLLTKHYLLRKIEYIEDQLSHTSDTEKAHELKKRIKRIKLKIRNL